MRRFARVCAVLALAGLVASGCGTPKPDSAGAVLRADATAIRSAAAQGDLAAADRAVTRLRSDLARLVSSNQVSAKEALDVLAAVRQVRSYLPLIAAEPTTTTTPVTTTRPLTTTTTRPAPSGGKHKKHHGGGGKGGGGKGGG